MSESLNTPTYLLHRQLMKLLKLRGMTYKELSIKSDVPIKTLYRWSYGEPPSRTLGSIYRVAEALGVSIEELVFDAMKEAPVLMERNPLDKLNDELRRELVRGLNGQGSNFLPNDLDLLALENPVIVPSYILFEIAKKLGRVTEICKILSKHGFFGDQCRAILEKK